MTGVTPDQIDGMILSTATERWSKVAMIILKVMSNCKDRNETVDEYDIADRIRALVDQGKLQAQGNLYFWRRSEVKLPN